MKIMYFNLINLDNPKTMGICNKIKGQVKVFDKYFSNSYRTVLTNKGIIIKENDIIVGEKKFNHTKFDFIEKRVVYYKYINEFIKSNNIEILYVRYPLADPFFINFLKECKKAGMKIYLEIATYPYDKELGKMTLLVDRLFRKRLSNYVDKILTFSDYERIYNINTIRIENGIDINTISVINNINNINSKEINLIGVASLSFWHGYDRIIRGLYEYYKTEQDVEVKFDIVGEGNELGNLKTLTNNLALEKYVRFWGFKTGEELDYLFNKSDLGVVSLGIHRLNLESVSTLKSKEYWARGLPFIKSYKDIQIDNIIGDYILTVEPNDNYIDINYIIDFYNRIKSDYGSDIHKNMRKLAEQYATWDFQLKALINEIIEN